MKHDRHRWTCLRRRSPQPKACHPDLHDWQPYHASETIRRCTRCYTFQQWSHRLSMWRTVHWGRRDVHLHL